jgi:hypothetical protein
MSKTYRITARFLRGYIADPYWPALDSIISIQKKSGLNRAKSDANRRKALEEYLQRENISVERYEQLVAESKLPFYLDEGNGEIVIPVLHVSSFLVAACDQARAANRPCQPEQVRSRFIFTPWSTGKRVADALSWERFATVTSGSGQTLSNQRGLRKSWYIGDFDAVGEIEFDEDFIEPASLKNALSWGGKFVGIGASRKMGWGRFELLSFDEIAGELKEAAE